MTLEVMDMAPRTPTTEIVQTAVRALMRKRAPGNPEDLYQQGMMIALETEQRYPDAAQNGGYVYTAVLRRLGNYVSASISSVSIGSRWELGREFQAHALPEVVYEQPSTTGTVEEQAVELEDDLHLLGWRYEVKRYLEEEIQPMFSEDDWNLIVRSYGLDGLPESKPRHLAEELGIDVRSIYRAVHRFENTIRDDINFHSLKSRL